MWVYGLMFLAGAVSCAGVLAACLCTRNTAFERGILFEIDTRDSLVYLRHSDGTEVAYKVSLKGIPWELCEYVGKTVDVVAVGSPRRWELDVPVWDEFDG